MRCTPEVHAYEVYVYEVHAVWCTCEVHVHEMHACKMQVKARKRAPRDVRRRERKRDRPT
jgi:hypothetical protein